MKSIHCRPAERSRLLTEFESSQMSAKAFAAKNGIPSSTFYQWLSRRARSKAPRIAKVIRAPSRAPAVKADPTGAPLVIELGACRVQVPIGFDHATLVTVLGVLDARERRTAR